MIDIKKIRHGLFIVVGLVTILAYSAWRSGCFGIHCELNFIRSILKPLAAGGPVLLAVLTLMYAVPISYYKNWLLYIASWYVPVSIFLVSQIDIYSSSILSVDRGPAAQDLMIGLAAITVVFVVVLFVTEKLCARRPRTTDE